MIFILSRCMSVLCYFFADRFGFESLTKSVMQLLYSWSYSLRLAMHAVYPQTINKYSMGQHERINYGIDMFTKISEMTDPEELKMLTFNQPSIEKTIIKKNTKQCMNYCVNGIGG